MKGDCPLQRQIVCVAALFLCVLMPLFAKAKADSSSPAMPERVVALSKSVADMWLLAGGRLSGTTSDALELDGIDGAVSVGTLTTASLEAIVSLKPDLVLLTLDIPLHKKFVGTFRDLGISTYIVNVKYFSDYEKVMRDFTGLTGRKDLFEKNVASVKRDIDAICASSQVQRNRKEKAATYLFLRASATKNKVLKDHFGNEIFVNLGLQSIISDESALDEVSVEAIVRADPAYIFVTSQGNQQKADEAFYRAYASNPAWKNLRAVKDGHVIMLPKDLFNYKPNAQWAKAYEYVLGVL